uniref:Uncharacterized protein n=1 Tax=Leersia perrieri TaxID=77586 RepID=A0A0D9UZG1_9ORYZ
MATRHGSAIRALVGKCVRRHASVIADTWRGHGRGLREVGRAEIACCGSGVGGHRSSAKKLHHHHVKLVISPSPPPQQQYECWSGRRGALPQPHPHPVQITLPRAQAPVQEGALQPDAAPSSGWRHFSRLHAYLAGGPPPGIRPSRR